MESPKQALNCPLACGACRLAGDKLEYGTAAERCAARRLVLALHNPAPRARVFGFKEIYSPFVRDPTATGAVLEGVAFLRLLFPRARFVFHTRRNLSRAADSDFWRRDWSGPEPPDRATRLARISAAATIYREYARGHADHAFATTLEGLTSREDAHGEVAGLLRFLHEPLTHAIKKVARSNLPLRDWAEEKHTRVVKVRAANGTVLGVERRQYRYTERRHHGNKGEKKGAPPAAR